MKLKCGVLDTKAGLMALSCAQQNRSAWSSMAHATERRNRGRAIQRTERRKSKEFGAAKTSGRSIKSKRHGGGRRREGGGSGGDSGGGRMIRGRERERDGGGEEVMGS